ncbi:Transient receptor putative cation channel subfamily M member 3 [Cichlidogyrus casuarinus]|uniref:Transient receptor putative cation channel subfamily M member 3 n=1 Tax=Cichlidogyrus casuarinus TaxID=1844966 RepID=A0ABD2Q8V8_9PLAT
MDMRLCMKRKDLISVFRMGDGTSDEIDIAILTALLQASEQKLTIAERLSLTMAWNRPDIARSKVFTGSVKFHADMLNNAMADALLNDRLDFVKLLLEKGLSIQQFLTTMRLEELYVALYTTCPTFQRLFNKVIGARQKINLRLVGQLLEQLIGHGYQHTYCAKSFTYNIATTSSYTQNTWTIGRLAKIASSSESHIVVNTSSEEAMNNEHLSQQTELFRYPYTELLQWTLLAGRFELARYMVLSGEESIAKSLISVRILRGMRKESNTYSETEFSHQLRKWGETFEELAVELQEHCYRNDAEQAKRLLTYELGSFSKNTCLSLAYLCESKVFISHLCTQSILNDLWYGGLREGQFVSGKVAIILIGLVIPPVYPLIAYLFTQKCKYLEFKTREELARQPQTLEEFLDDQHTSDSSNSSHSSSSSSDIVRTKSLLWKHSKKRRRKKRKVHIKPAINQSSGDEIEPHAARTTSKDESHRKKNAKKMSTAGTTTDAPQSRFENEDAKIGPNSGLPTGIGQSSQSTWAEPNMNNVSTTSAPPVHCKQLSYRKKIYEFFSAPVTRFYFHVILYLLFLVLYIGMCIHLVPQNEVSWLELYVYLHIITYFLEKFREVTLNPGVSYFQRFRVHLQSFWNVYDIIMCSCSTIGIIVRYAGWNDYITYMYGRNLLVVCCSLWVLRFLELMQIWRFCGPYIYIMVKMLRALIPVLPLLLIPLIAFGTLRWGIMQSYNSTTVDLEGFKGVLLKPYFMLYGEMYASEIDPNDWQAKLPWYQVVPIAMFIYLLYSFLLMINLIIAIFNAIFSTVQQQSALVYKYLRYAVIIEYESRPLLPPPFIVIYWVYAFFRSLNKLVPTSEINSVHLDTCES